MDAFARAGRFQEVLSKYWVRSALVTVLGRLAARVPSPDSFDVLCFFRVHPGAAVQPF